MIAEITAAFTALNARDDVRAVVLTANGKAFCAGADLNWMKKMAAYSDDENRADAMLLAKMLQSVYRCNKPVIARVNGDAYAGGMGLIAACDIVVAVESARFCLSEARLGLIPATIAPYVIRALGEQASRRYFTTAEAFDCATALRLGFVSEAVNAEQLDTTVQQIADTLCANGPQAVRACKQLVQDIAGRELNDAMIEDTAARIARTRAGAEGREGVASFLEKRTPGWRN
jgi:methylglutaconyl-CoA hydratase